MTEPSWLEPCWVRLALAPGADLLSIKRAYARELKRCRPDADPQAYQSLREAYEQLMAYARWQAQEAAEQDDAVEPGAVEPGPKVAPIAEAAAAGEVGAPTCSDDTVAMPDADATAEADSSAPDALGFVPPEMLARSLHAYFDEHGAEATAALWPQLHYALDDLPLSLRDDASSWFASLVLECPELPHSLVSDLAQYFQWHSDYRSQFVLGERAPAMAERLRRIGLIRIRDPQVLRRYERILQLKTHLERGQIWMARLLAALSTGRIREKVVHTEAELLRGLGMDDLLRYRIDQLMKFGGRIRFALVAVSLLLAHVLIQGQGVQSALNSSAQALVMLFGLRLCLLLSGYNLELRGPMGRWTAGTRIGVATGAWVVLAWLLIAADSRNYTLLAMLGGWGIMLAWTGNVSWTPLLVPLAVVSGYVLASLTELSWIEASCICAVQALLSHWLLSTHYDRVVALFANLMPDFGSLSTMDWIMILIAIVPMGYLAGLVLVACLPLIYLVQSQFYGVRFALTSLGLVAGLLLVLPANDTLPLVLLVAIPILTGFAQRSCDRLARRLSASRANG